MPAPSATTLVRTAMNVIFVKVSQKHRAQLLPKSLRNSDHAIQRFIRILSVRSLLLTKASKRNTMNLKA